MGGAAATEGLAERARELLDLALRAGAGEAEVCAHSRKSLGAKVEKGDLGQVTADEGSTLGLRVVLDGRLGFASTNQAHREALESAARDAVAIARLSPADEANVLPEPAAVDDGARIGARVDPSLAGMAIEDVVDRARELAGRTASSDERISVDQASFSVVAGESMIVSSKGVDQRDRDAALTMSLMALATDGDETGGMDYRGTVVRDASEVEGELHRIADEVASNCVGNLGATSGSSYSGPVLFAPSAFSSALLSPLLGSVSAIAVQRGRSALANRLGEVVAPGLSVVDDPTDLHAAGACAFDREGLPARRFPIVEGGTLRSFLHNAYSAAVDGVQSTGHARGGARGVPGLGAHAIVVSASDPDAPEDLDALLAQLGEGLYIQRFSGTVDAASGDFSGTAKSARWVEGGRIVRPVQEVMLSGNAFELFTRGAVLSRTQERLGGSSLVAWSLVDGVSVTAG
ncbi:MAG: TldD/PmbA family protein [Planctomycetota bacterium]